MAIPSLPHVSLDFSGLEFYQRTGNERRKARGPRGSTGGREGEEREGGTRGGRLGANSRRTAGGRGFSAKVTAGVVLQKYYESRIFSSSR